MKSNKGFSLVELIIVIAIMAILVGVMAPQLIKYIEKSNVSADTQLADTVRGAFLCAVTDARVLADDASEPFFTTLSSDAGMNVDADSAFLTSDCVMKESVDEILGISLNTLPNQLKSKHSSNSHFNVKLANGNKVVVTITGTDNTAKKDTSDSTPNNDISVE